jgi:hypothetical protein
MTNHPPTQLPNRLTEWLVLAVLLALVMALESFALYTVFTTRYPGANDFYVRWLGGREFLLHGTNPFDRSVAEEAQIGMFVAGILAFVIPLLLTGLSGLQITVAEMVYKFTMPILLSLVSLPLMFKRGAARHTIAPPWE